MSQNVAVHYQGFLEGHNGWVTSLQVGQTKEGKPLLISGSRDKSIIVWKLDLENPEEIKNEKGEVVDSKVGLPNKSLHGHNHFVSSLALNSTSNKLISGSWDKTARLWDIPTFTTQKILAQHSKDVLAVSFSQNERVIFTGAMDRTLKYWNTQGEMKHSNSAFKGWVTSIVNINKGKEHYMAVGCMDGDVSILDHEYSIIRTIKGEEYGVTSLSASDEGDFLFVGYKNGVVKLFALANDPQGEDVLKQTIETNVDVNAISFNSSHFAIVALGTSAGLQIRNVKKGTIAYENKDIKSPCLSLAYDESKKYLFAGHADGTIRVYTIENAQE